MHLEAYHINVKIKIGIVIALALPFSAKPSHGWEHPGCGDVVNHTSGVMIETTARGGGEQSVVLCAESFVLKASTGLMWQPRHSVNNSVKLSYKMPSLTVGTLKYGPELREIPKFKGSIEEFKYRDGKELLTSLSTKMPYNVLKHRPENEMTVQWMKETLTARYYTVYC